MALPQKTAALDQYYEAGVYLTAALSLENVTAGLEAPLSALEQEYLAHQTNFRLARTEQIRAYVRVVWADRKMEDCIRDLSDTAKSSDRKQPALRAHARIFPTGGFTSLIQPSGRMIGDQIKNVRKLFPVLQELAAKEPAFQDFPTKLETLCVDAETHLNALTTADSKVEQLYVQADLFRDRWREQAYLVEAELQKLFPGQKDRVRAYFETPGSSRASSKKDTTTTPAATGDAPTNTTTPPASTTDPSSSS